MTIRDKIKKIQYWYMDRIINKWDDKVLPCDEATEKSTDKLLTLIKQVVEEVIEKDEKVIIDDDLPTNVNDDINEGGISRNQLRKEQRAKLKKLLK